MIEKFSRQEHTGIVATRRILGRRDASVQLGYETGLLLLEAEGLEVGTLLPDEDGNVTPETSRNSQWQIRSDDNEPVRFPMTNPVLGNKNVAKGTFAGTSDSFPGGLLYNIEEGGRALSLTASQPIVTASLLDRDASLCEFGGFYMDDFLPYGLPGSGSVCVLGHRVAENRYASVAGVHQIIEAESQHNETEEDVDLRTSELWDVTLNDTSVGLHSVSRRPNGLILTQLQIPHSEVLSPQQRMNMVYEYTHNLDAQDLYPVVGMHHSRLFFNFRTNGFAYARTMYRDVGVDVVGVEGGLMDITPDGEFPEYCERVDFVLLEGGHPRVIRTPMELGDGGKWQPKGRPQSRFRKFPMDWHVDKTFGGSADPGLVDAQLTKGNQLAVMEAQRLQRGGLTFTHRDWNAEVTVSGHTNRVSVFSDDLGYGNLDSDGAYFTNDEDAELDLSL